MVITMRLMHERVELLEGAHMLYSMLQKGLRNETHAQQSKLYITQSVGEVAKRGRTLVSSWFLSPENNLGQLCAPGNFNKHQCQIYTF